MLLNLSNHPSSLWDAKQMQAAAEQYGKVTDMPFPEISPEADTAEIAALARDYFNLVIERLNKSDDACSAVHLMGEMTFSYYLTGLLQQAGVLCVASTSVRNVISDKDGQKTVSFNFHQFREYPSLCKNQQP